MGLENGWTNQRKHFHLLRVINMSNFPFELPIKNHADIETVQNAFQTIIGRSVTDQEKERLYKIKDELSIKNDDPLWVLLLQLERYSSLYDEVPGKISGVVNECIANIKAATVDEIRQVELDIERKAFKASQAYATCEYNLLHQINEATERMFMAQQKALTEASALEQKLKIWKIVSFVTLIQMLIIITTNSVTAIIASGNPKLPWIALKEGDTQGDWLFQMIFNFPASWLISIMMIFGIAFVIYDGFIAKKG